MRNLRSAMRRGVCVAAVLLMPAVVGCSAIGGPVGDVSVEQRLQTVADQEWTALSAQYPSAVRPDSTLVEIVDPDDWAPVIAGCMNDLGFPNVTAGDDGSLQSGDFVTSQAEAYDLALFECNVMYPVDPKYSEPLTSEQVDALYAYYKDTLAPCLEDQGYHISPAPSLQTFQQTYDSGPWLPYAEIVASVSPDELNELYDVCPDVPANFWD